MNNQYTKRPLQGDPPIPDKYTQDTIGALLRRSARRYPNKTAFKYKSNEITYEEFDELANQFANGIRDLGISQGDTIAVMAKNSFKYLVTWFGTARSGAVHVPLHGELSAQEYDFFIDKVHPNLLVIDDELLDRVKSRIQNWGVDYIPFSPNPNTEADSATFPEKAPKVLMTDMLQTADTSEPNVGIDSDDVVQILFTSGTTSKPKGVMHMHSNLISQYVPCINEFSIERDERTLAVMPLFHVAQLHNITMPVIYRGASEVILRDFNPVKALNAIEENNITKTLMFSTLYRQLINHENFEEYDLSSLRKGIYALQMDVEEVQKSIDIPFVKGFGLTEMGSFVSALHPAERSAKASSLGRPLGNLDIGIMDEDGDLLPAGETGEIVYRGSQLMAGYYRDDERTEEAFKYDWFHSGDLGYLDDESYLWFVDRKKDLIKTGGENVSSIEIEDTLRSHSAVQEVAVVGLPHERWGEAVTAFVSVETDNITEDQLIQYCKEELAGYKIPKSIIFVEDFPESASGKIQKHGLRDKYETYYE